MTSNTKGTLSTNAQIEILDILGSRFENNMHRHPKLEWTKIRTRLSAQTDKMWSLIEMERTGGEPDVVGYDQNSDQYVFVDCATESPKGRRSLCYDREALDARKAHKPKNSAMDMASEMGVEILSEAEYRDLQQLENFDAKTSSWLKTPQDIRKHGGAIFGDFRFNHLFIYHNGAESYYAARGFRGVLRV